MASSVDPTDITGNPAGYIIMSRGAGWTPSEALRTYQADGGSIGRSSWFRLWGEVTDSLARQPAAGALDPYAVPAFGDYATWSMGAGGEYATSINVHFRDRDTGIIGTKQYDYISAEPHSPADAAAAAMAAYGDDSAQAEYGQTMVGWSTKNVYQTVPWIGRT